ncbi:uncharacterized protein LOC128213119 [Mya arenaria]|uniref:uncharacterized protein LOC128213119 n=1 Tax=Mya arenaria TaxID=6604 RepID=UPI0022E6E1A6|nr:uncharacterized protein LOC128213119 [Mya arenaria]
MSSLGEAQKELKELLNSKPTSIAPLPFIRVLSVLKIPEGSSTKLTTLKTVEAAKAGFTGGVLSGLWVTIMDQKYEVSTTFTFRKKALVDNAVRSGVAGIILGGTFVGAMEALARLRNGKSDALNAFGAAFACVAPFAIYRRNPMMFLAAGITWGSIAGALRLASGSEYSSFLKREPDAPSQPSIYPETVVYFENLKREMAFRKKQQEMNEACTK